ncbi:MAG: glycosyltransferase, partial [Candidatus Caldarchaeum sp.]
MKVLYVIDTLEVGGTEKSLYEICRRFHRAKVVMCHIYSGEHLKPLFEAAGIPVISLNIPGKYAFLKAAHAVRSIIAQEQPDLLHVALFRAGIVARLATWSTKFPLIDSFVSDSYSEERKKALSTVVRWKLMGLWVLDRWTANRAFRFTANSYAVKEANCRALGVNPEKVQVIYRGRDPNPFLEAPAGSGGAPDRGAPRKPSGPLVLNVGRLLYLKGQQDLVAAMASVTQKIPKIRLWIAGEGPDRIRLEERLREYNLEKVVKLLGTRNDVPRLLQLADIFVFPSYSEGHPGALVEAMFAAKPIVASDTPFHREIISHQKTGLLVPIKDEAALANAMVWMLR